MEICLDNINKCESELFVSNKIKGVQFLTRTYILSVPNFLLSFYRNRNRIITIKAVIKFTVELSRQLC